MIYIRTDMNRIIATGHIMRCLAIADAAKTLLEDTTFILSDEQAEDYIKDKGYRTIVLHTPWDNMESELSIIEELIKRENIRTLFIDSYQVTDSYLKALSKITRVVYLDDLNAFSYPVAGIVCYASYWKKFEHSKNYPNTGLLLGTKYAPLRDAFTKVAPKQIKEKVESILLLSGGTDEYQILENVLKSLDLNEFLEITVICGRYYREYETLVARYRVWENVHIYQSVNDIENYMKQADLAISAGGTTLYELCACGTPTISFAIADNQLENVHQFDEDGVIAYAGDIRCDDVVSNVVKLVRKYSKDKTHREYRSKKMQSLIDGQGAYRIAKALMNDF